MDYETKNILLTEIDEPADAMRTDIDRDAIFELGNDIERNGLINPITVRPRGERYEIVAGHRRYLAHRYKGIAIIRCIVRELNDDEAFAVMTSENLAREDVNPVDEATHTARLMEHCGGDMSKVMGMLNRGREWVVSRLAVAEMPDDLKSHLRDGKIKLGVALALNEITDDQDRDTCLQMAVSQGASLVVAQYWVAQWKAGIFGNAARAAGAGVDVPNAPSPVVMLRDALDEQDYPASDMVTVLISRKNSIYIEGLREHLRQERQRSESSPVLSENVGGGESS